MAEATKLPVESIRMDGGTQSRTVIDPETIDTYLEAMVGGAVFPPIVVFYDGETYWLADGFHRLYATKKSMARTVDADVRQGTRRDAIFFGLGANARHGKPPSKADKRQAVTTLLRDPEWSSKMSDGEMARHCGVDRSTVTKIRGELATSDNHKSPAVRTGADGRTINTANIGKTRKLPEKTEAKACTASTQAALAVQHEETDEEPVSETKPTVATPKPPPVAVVPEAPAETPSRVHAHADTREVVDTPDTYGAHEAPDVCGKCNGRRFRAGHEKRHDGSTDYRWVCLNEACGKVTRPDVPKPTRAKQEASHQSPLGQALGVLDQLDQRMGVLAEAAYRNDRNEEGETWDHARKLLAKTIETVKEFGR